ncbi:MAG: cytochrome C biogenesis protein, partial [Cyanobacteria bacterium P01_A01_bin.135]
MKRLNIIKFLVGLCLGCMLILLPFSQFQPDSLDGLRTLAVQENGRKKPLDTVAKETLAKINGATTYRHSGEKEDYLTAYLSMWFNSRNWNEEPVVLVSYRPLKAATGLDLERKRFTFAELMTNRELGAVVGRAHQKEAQDLDLSRDEREALTIESRLNLLYQTVADQNLPVVPHPSEVKGKWSGIKGATELYGPEAIAP